MCFTFVIVLFLIVLYIIKYLLMVNGDDKNVKYLTVFVSVRKKKKYIINIHYIF